VAISWPCPFSVEAYAAHADRVVAPRFNCPGCGRPLSFDGSYPRQVREAGVVHAIRVPRAACRGCGTTHALLPDFVAYRRRDSVEAIGAAVAPDAAGGRPGPLWAGVPARTVRSWRSRFAERAELLTAGLVAVATTHSGVAPILPVPALATTLAVAAVGAAWWAASQRWPGRIARPWRFANTITGSGLFSTRVDLPWAGLRCVPCPARAP